MFDKSRSHHGMSHNQGTFIDDLLKLDDFHMQQFAYLLEKMDAISEANGSSLLDKTIFTYASGLGDGAAHQYSALPTIVAGSGGGTIVAGKHLNMVVSSAPQHPEKWQYKKAGNGALLANLCLTQAHAMGLKTKRFADSTGTICQLLA